MMQTKGLYKSLLGTGEQPNEPPSLANGASNDEKKNHKVLNDSNEKEVAGIKEQRNKVRCNLALSLDATILVLMRMTMRLRHRRWSKGLEAFAREISECGDADSGEFGGTACSTATRGC